jgi:hypothetical protein
VAPVSASCGLVRIEAQLLGSLPMARRSLLPPAARIAPRGQEFAAPPAIQTPAGSLLAPVTGSSPARPASPPCSVLPRIGRGQPELTACGPSSPESAVDWANLAANRRSSALSLSVDLVSLRISI